MKIRESWNKTAEKFLLGRKIVAVEYMSPEESSEAGWTYQAVCFKLDNDSWVYPMRDDEGNDAGALCVGADTLPVLRGDK
tara:strand:- start:3105 stop:3344 length:240 start_codon:yes stop_codon:yes gene_type:complete